MYLVILSIFFAFSLYGLFLDWLIKEISPNLDQLLKEIEEREK